MFPDSGNHVNLDQFAQRSSYSFLEGVSNQDWQPSTYGPTVWTGRALQAESSEWQWLVLRFCIRPLRGADRSWPSWISARVRSHSEIGLEGQLGHQIMNATARPFSILQIQLADLGGYY